jgi:predicted alpha/beta hydrolase family esterase
MAFKIRSLILLFSVVMLVGLMNVHSKERATIDLAFLGSAAAELSGNRDAVGFLSSQQFCDPTLSSVNTLNSSASFLAGYHESEFVPDLKRLKTFELLRLQPMFRGIAISGAKPLGWARLGDSFFARRSDGSFVAINAQTSETTILGAALSNQIESLSRKRAYLGFSAGFVIFGPNNEERNITLVDLEGGGGIIRLAIDFVKAGDVDITCLPTVVCRATISFPGSENGSPISKQRTVVQVIGFSATDGSVIYSHIKTSPELTMAHYIGQLPNQTDLWLGFRGNNRNVFVQNGGTELLEIVSPIGDINHAYLQADHSLVLENFSSEFAIVKGLAAPIESKSNEGDWVRKSQHLLAISKSGQLVRDPGTGVNTLTSLEGKITRDASLGCTPSSYTGKWKSLEDSGYHEFLPKLQTPIGLAVYFHGGPFQQASEVPSPLVSAWLDRGFKVWVMEAPGTPGFGLEHLLPSPQYIRRYASILQQRIIEEQTSLNIDQKSEFQTVVVGHSFGGFVVIQLSKIIDELAISTLVLVNSSCRDFMRLQSADGHSSEYAHAQAVGQAYQMLQPNQLERQQLCGAKSTEPIFVFASDNDTVVPRAHSELVAKATKVEILVLKNEEHSIVQNGGRIVAETVLGRAPRG